MDAASNRLDDRFDSLFDAYKKAETMIAEGNLRQAADLCKEMLDANPQYPYGYHLMASLFSATGTFERALSFAQTATQLAPEVCAFHIQHGQLLYALGAYEAAALSFTAACNIEPLNPIILLLLASTFTGRGRYAEAHGLYLRARSLSDMPEIDEQEGLCHFMQGNHQEAEILFDRIIARCPDYIWGHIYKGQVLMEGRQHTRAEASMARALRIDAHSFDALFALAVLNDWQGQHEIAIRYAMEAIRSRPLCWECHTFLGALLVRERHYAEGQQVLTQALAIRPHDPYVLQLLLFALRIQGREQEFLPHIHEAAPGNPRNDVLLHLQAMAEGQTPDTAPAAYIRGYYDSFADQYDHYQKDVLSYEAPRHMATLIREWRTRFPHPPLATMLDLGCGTGLMAQALKDPVSYRVGVDMSSRMLARARGKHLYHALHQQDMVEHMLASAEGYDLVTAADALSHTGDLSLFLKAARNVLNIHGLLVFTVEKNTRTDTWLLGGNGRYSHAPHYVVRKLEAKGYEILHQQDHALFIDNNLAVSGMLFMARKTPTH